MNIYKMGLDIGSTTAKIVVLDDHNNIIFSGYERHQTNILPVIIKFLEQLKAQVGNCGLNIKVTGSVGMGIAENYKLPFVQEVIAATEFVKTKYPEVSTIIDIGGEDAKIVYMNKFGATDLRMNGNCAGGTGAFIDQMSILLGVDISDMDTLAQKADHTYSIASRCGVFAKTDIQNLLSKNVSKANIASSIFRAVTVQSISSLSHGCKIIPKVLLCGGPLTFIPALRKAFASYLKFQEADFVLPPNAHLIPAWGAALYAIKQPSVPLDALIGFFNDSSLQNIININSFPPIFSSPEEYALWKEEKSHDYIEQIPLENFSGSAYIGIDSGSTTTKIIVIDDEDKILFSYYAPNDGNPINAARKGLEEFNLACQKVNASPKIISSCSTGYGEDLIKAAFKLDTGIIETIAHYLAARKINPKVSFILDIGGQDMKAMFVENNVLSRMEINEACSSGCGSFIETFAKSMNFSLTAFAAAACLANHPSDLGTRCTVFMNSKVKQVLREGASINNIAAGLSYSVIKNCLYKVLKLKNTKEMGTEIVLQGGTMKNDSVVRTFEILTGVKVHRSNIPEIMGAYGCALYAKANGNKKEIALETMLLSASYTTKIFQCGGCENNCYISKYNFANGNTYFSGNKCEKIFSQNGEVHIKGENVYTDKYEYLFNRKNTNTTGTVIGLPRCLNMYENYPFWHKLFDACGLQVCLSDPSLFANYEEGIHSIMSDNICFPAKLVHSHIYNLISKNVDRIFMPYVIYEKSDDKKQDNSFNCPIVSGYSDVIRSVTEESNSIPIDSPVITFKDEGLLKVQCSKYLASLGIKNSTAQAAIKLALAEQREYENTIKARNKDIYTHSKKNGNITVLLAGRPYHADPLVQHKLSDFIASLGINVLSEDIVRNDDSISTKNSFLVEQWAYINRILKAAQWVADQDSTVHFMQMTSFGCGPDAFLLDEVRNILACSGKALTILKIDDVANIGSLKLRVRSVVDSIAFNRKQPLLSQPSVNAEEFTKDKKGYKIIAPFFTEFVSPLIPSLFKLNGYDIDILPPSDKMSVDYGLKYANNEVCYPATLVVGDIIKALKSGKYDCLKTAVALTQTGGQCRASNYVALIKRSLIEAGFKHVPVISISLDKNLHNQQPGFKVNWWKIWHISLTILLYSDCISKFYFASVVREKTKGVAQKLKDKYLELAQVYIQKNDSSGLIKLLSLAAKEFNTIVSSDKPLPKVGIVGEIYLKFNSFAHKNVCQWMLENNIEIVPPILTNFFMQAFVNRQVNEEDNLQRKHFPNFIVNTIYKKIDKQIQKVNELGKDFRYFMPFTNIFTDAKNGQEIINLAAQFGEGWLLPGEVVTFAKQGINNVISLEPFGCIANHIVAKGIEKKIKTLYPQMNLLALDFDSGVSDVNVTNRLLLFAANIKTL